MSPSKGLATTLLLMPGFLPIPTPLQPHPADPLLVVASVSRSLYPNSFSLGCLPPRGRLIPSRSPFRCHLLRNTFPFLPYPHSHPCSLSLFSTSHLLMICSLCLLFSICLPMQNMSPIRARFFALFINVNQTPRAVAVKHRSLINIC